MCTAWNQCLFEDVEVSNAEVWGNLKRNSQWNNNLVLYSVFNIRILGEDVTLIHLRTNEYDDYATHYTIAAVITFSKGSLIVGQ